MHKQKNQSKNGLRQKKLNKLLDKYSHYLDMPSKLLPDEHRAPLNGGLRCFQKVYQRDKNNNKIKDKKKIRCNNPSVKKSFFCKKHGGGNSHALVHGNRTNYSMTGGQYGKNMDGHFSDLLEVFLNDPKITDLKPELAAMRMMMSEFLEELTSDKPKISPKKLVGGIKRILKIDTMTPSEKFSAVRDICSSQSFLTDGDSIDRLSRLVGEIGKTVERMHRIQTQDNFILTADGLKVFIRSIVDILKEKVEDNVLGDIREQLLKISMQTKGNLSEAREKIHDADFRTING